MSRKLKSFYFIGVPWLSGKSSKMFFEILDAKTMTVLYTSKDAVMKKFDYTNPENDKNEKNELLPPEDADLIIFGDLLFRLKNGMSMTQGTL